MTSPEQLMFLQDIARLPKEVLFEAAEEWGLSPRGLAAQELADRVWRSGRESRGRLTRFVGRVFAGKTSVAWYPFSSTSPEQFFAAAAEVLGYDPLESTYRPADEDLGTVPIVVGGTRLGSGQRYLLRVIYRSRYGLVFGLSDNLQQPPRLSSVLMDFDNSFFEVRGDLHDNPRNIKRLRQMLGEQIDEVAPFKVLERYEQSLESFANALNGEIVDANSGPEHTLESLTAEQLDTVFDVLSACDDYIMSDDERPLLDALAAARPYLRDLGHTPLSALVLAGMQRVRLSSADDLRVQPLFKLVSPHLHHYGGVIRFPWAGGTATIRVGLLNNSVYFMTPATEEMIDYVRSLVLTGQQERGQDEGLVAS